VRNTYPPAVEAARRHSQCADSGRIVAVVPFPPPLIHRINKES
jgi:hypothetical protein